MSLRDIYIHSDSQGVKVKKYSFSKKVPCYSCGHKTDDCLFSEPSVVAFSHYLHENNLAKSWSKKVVLDIESRKYPNQFVIFLL